MYLNADLTIYSQLAMVQFRVKGQSQLAMVQFRVKGQSQLAMVQFRVKGQSQLAMYSLGSKVSHLAHCIDQSHTHIHLGIVCQRLCRLKVGVPMPNVHTYLVNEALRIPTAMYGKIGLLQIIITQMDLHRLSEKLLIYVNS